MENWKPIPSAPNYEASSLGRVRRANSKRLLTPKRERNGYLRVCMCHDGKAKNQSVHRLVCEAFYGPPKHGQHCAHADGSRDNNAYENLRWVWPVENEQDKRAHGRTATGERVGGAKLKSEDIPDIRRRRALGEPASSIAIDYGVTRYTIQKISKGKHWRSVP